MLTARGQEPGEDHGPDLGADDYVTKPFSPQRTAGADPALLRRTATPPPRRLPFGDVEVDFARGELRRGGQPST